MKRIKLFEEFLSEAAKNGKNYSFYVSFPIINKMVDFDNKDHVDLIKFMKEIDGGETITKPKAAKARRMIKKALGDVGETGLNFIDLSFRECKYPTWEENDKNLPKNCNWVDVEKIPV